MAFPLIPGKTEQMKSVARQLVTERKEEFENAQETVSKEQWFIQPTPIGDMIIVSFECPDPAAVFSGMASSQEPFETWFREQVLECSGVDLSIPMTTFPEQILDWRKATS